jgi:hypothetical protein
MTREEKQARWSCHFPSYPMWLCFSGVDAISLDRRYPSTTDSDGHHRDPIVIHATTQASTAPHSSAAAFTPSATSRKNWLWSIEGVKSGIGAAGSKICVPMMSART